MSTDRINRNASDRFRVELAMFYNGKFRAWQDMGVASREDAWKLIRSHGFTVADQGDMWIVSKV